MLSLFVQIIFILFLLVWLIFFTVQFFNIVFRGYAPFVSTKRKVLDKIVAELQIKNDAAIYELGCGRAGFLRILRKKYPRAELVGIEYSFLPYIIARVQNALTGSRLKIRKKNIFEVNLSAADLIYCYLNMGTMLTLEKKFLNECRPGALIISYQFPLMHTKEDRVIKIGRQDRVYFYTINKKN